MKALWIKVGPHEADSLVVARLSETLRLDPIVVLGHLVALTGAVAEHQPDGSIESAPDASIELWASWRGRRGAFAAAVRKHVHRDYFAIRVRRARISPRPRRRDIPMRIRMRVFARDQYRCVHCGASDRPLTLDHIIPYSKGGPDTEENLQSACKPCNSGRRP